VERRPRLSYLFEFSGVITPLGRSITVSKPACDADRLADLMIARRPQAGAMIFIDRKIVGLKRA
jgi:hypothetical protein